MKDKEELDQVSSEEPDRISIDIVDILILIDKGRCS